MKTDGRKVDPQSLTSLLFGLSTSGWVIFATAAYSHYAHYDYFQDKYVEFDKWIVFFTGFITYVIVNYIYSANDRYLKVYNKYISFADSKSKGRLIFLSFTFILLPYILIIFVLIFG